MAMIPEDQMPYYGARQQFDWMKRQAPKVIPVPQIQFQQLEIGNVIADALGKLLVVGAGVAFVFGVSDMLFSDEKTVRSCSGCGKTGHTARNCPVIGPRTRLTIEKIGICECCGGDVS